LTRDIRLKFSAKSVLIANALPAPLVIAKMLVSAAAGEAITTVFIVPIGLFTEDRKVTELPPKTVAFQIVGEFCRPTYNLPSARLPLKDRLLTLAAVF
jgi:hypothetical protein